MNKWLFRWRQDNLINELIIEADTQVNAVIKAKSLGYRRLKWYSNILRVDIVNTVVKL